MNTLLLKVLILLCPIFFRLEVNLLDLHAAAPLADPESPDLELELPASDDVQSWHLENSQRSFVVANLQLHIFLKTCYGKHVVGGREKCLLRVVWQKLHIARQHTDAVCLANESLETAQESRQLMRRGLRELRREQVQVWQQQSHDLVIVLPLHEALHGLNQVFPEQIQSIFS